MIEGISGVRCYTHFVIPEEEFISQGRGLLQALGPQIRDLFTRYGVPDAPAQALLEESLLMLARYGRAVERPAVWLLATLEHKCSRYAHGRRIGTRGRGEPGEPAMGAVPGSWAVRGGSA